MTPPSWLTAGYQFWMPARIPLSYHVDSTFAWKQFNCLLRVVDYYRNGRNGYSYLMKVRVVEVNE